MCAAVTVILPYSKQTFTRLQEPGCGIRSLALKSWCQSEFSGARDLCAGSHSRFLWRVACSLLAVWRAVRMCFNLFAQSVTCRYLKAIIIQIGK